MFSIGDVSKKLQIPASKIRYYESEGLIPPAVRKSGRRVYLQNDIDAIRMIQLGRELGLSISALKGLSKANRHDALDRLLEQTEDRISTLSARRNWIIEAQACGCSAPANCALVR